MELSRVHDEKEKRPSDDALIRTWFGGFALFWEFSYIEGEDIWYQATRSAMAINSFATWAELRDMPHRVYYPTDREDGEEEGK